MKTILVPVDFSPSSINACHYALGIARLTQSKIILFHAFETPVIYSEAQLLASQIDMTRYREQAEADLKELHATISGISEGISLEMMLQQGLPSARIIETAHERKADLIVMGTTGKGKVERLLIGSNASRLVKDAPCLVLLVPPDATYSSYSKIVYATDLSEDNLLHAPAIIPFSKAFNAELLFLNVHFHHHGHVEDDMKAMVTKIRKYVHYPKVSGFFCHDQDIGKGIAYFLKAQQAGCLAMYTRHRSLLGTLLNRSLTGKVALNTSIPLLVIHENDFPEIDVNSNEPG